MLFPENPATPFILSDTTLNLMLTSPLALAALVLSWMFLLIGVPHALRNTIPDNVEALRATNTLKKIGLWYLILSTVIFLICTPEVFLIKTLMLKPVAISMIVFFKSTISIAVFALWIIYWVKIVAFRKKYLVQVETK
ncbi:MAG: hypothetical protein A3I77_07290 [Gammaproteobacteria bacterium RIFCSPLOWO2_02_FULL_42_14]|nr:MAG: hypothetical protein A3B71_03125 [Gammaproteobacteria bacterium RIFCSPHIGHO2_02_FULL_42_43]OGT29139.1 MAG: hypothetical protein A2624_04245 [Gammaproteobacteria bacterium RIFCSPHIGHO2_01_FULL_42_8]OGT52479.1 MAG: hypothetical protein A3E54_00605 [Gammaproteobacteria bacterium RIFCSPHIGHO2_12_FULL_41_25]OGT61161.1 MAG: hypothetical protein A3I77_07290 [Gammaproteobacteria bacterium RIFCSPLOWO2_02_FULL_42_14]OGT87089.1 MAG: hypothetical protein A3G86_01010 [Gammaproteobacteria bacterium R